MNQTVNIVFYKKKKKKRTKKKSDKVSGPGFGPTLTHLHIPKCISWIYIHKYTDIPIKSPWKHEDWGMKRNKIQKLGFWGKRTERRSAFAVSTSRQRHWPKLPYMIETYPPLHCSELDATFTEELMCSLPSNVKHVPGIWPFILSGGAHSVNCPLVSHLQLQEIWIDPICFYSTQSDFDSTQSITQNY